MKRIITFRGSVDSLETPVSRKCSTCPSVMPLMASRCGVGGFGCSVVGLDSLFGIASAASLFMSRAVRVWSEFVPLYKYAALQWSCDVQQNSEP